MTAELGRQPWLIYGLMRTSEGYSNTVSASNGLFTLLDSWALRGVGPAVHGSHLSRNQQRSGAEGCCGNPRD